MRDDVEVPETIPAKRRQLEDTSVVLDKWIAVWLARDDITPSERRRLEAEKARRKALKPERVVGLVVAREGMTPRQLVAVLDALLAWKPTSVVHTRLVPRVHGVLMAACRNIGAHATLIADVRDEDAAARSVVHAADAVIAAPREQDVQTYATPGVWATIGLARHRRLPVAVVLPSGELQQGGADG
jgi:hypothetical protein